MAATVAANVWTHKFQNHLESFVSKNGFGQFSKHYFNTVYCSIYKEQTTQSHCCLVDLIQRWPFNLGVKP